jgi:hypothetical protein
MSSCCGGPPGFVGAVDAACVSMRMIGKYSPLTYESKDELHGVKWITDTFNNTYQSYILGTAFIMLVTRCCTKKYRCSASN